MLVLAVLSAGWISLADTKSLQQLGGWRILAPFGLSENSFATWRQSSALLGGVGLFVAEDFQGFAAEDAEAGGPAGDGGDEGGEEHCAEEDARARAQRNLEQLF
jgi:hypothetical protein